MKSALAILFFLITTGVYSQSLKLDYKYVGNIFYHDYITLAHQFDGVNGSPMVTIYLINLQTNEEKLLLTEKWESDNWHYHRFNVSGWKNGLYKFLVGFGKDISKEIDFVVSNKK